MVLGLQNGRQNGDEAMHGQDIMQEAEELGGGLEDQAMLDIDA